MKKENQKLIKEIETMKAELTQLQSELEDNKIESALGMTVVIAMNWHAIKKRVKELYDNRDRAV